MGAADHRRMRRGSRRSDRASPEARETQKAPPFDRSDLAAAATIGCGALGLFLATLCPTIYVEDSAEFSTAAAVFGLPHPPGYPLHTLLSALFVRAIPFADMGYRSNLFSALCGALAVALLWVLLRRLEIGRTAALSATLCFALGATFWSQCLVAEVHALNCLLLVVVLLGVLEAARHPTARSFVCSGVAIGLLLGHRNLNVLSVPPLLVLLEVARRRAGGRARLFAGLVGAAAATGLLYLYLPLTARRDPPLNMGAPSTWRSFYAVISAHTYFRHLASAPAIVNARRFSHFLGRLPAELGIAALGAPVGFVVWRRRAGNLPVLCLTWIVVSCAAFACLYNVLDVDSYFLPAILALAILAAFGFDAWHDRGRLLLPFAALAALPLNFGSQDLRHRDLALTYAHDLFRSARPGAIVVSFGDTATHVLWYGQAVERLRPDVVVVSFDEIDDWYVDQLSRRHSDVDWPPADIEPEWLRAFVVRNVAKRPICLTAPVELSPSWKVRPKGLLYCLGPDVDPDRDRLELSRDVEFWNQSRVPVAGELTHADAHVQMVAFAYATSQFALASWLAGVGDPQAAKAQLVPLIAADPDATEAAITASLRRIGRFPQGSFSFGERAGRAVLLDARDPLFSELLSTAPRK